MDVQNAYGDVFRTRVHAKVNLVLGVGREDEANGLHPICSWMHAIDLCDEIEIRQVPDQQDAEYIIRWARGDGKDVPVEWTIEDDLGVRAHKVVEEHVGRRLPVRLRLFKSIPAGGGLGGGSADAGGVLMGLNVLFDLQLDHQTLVKLAMKLGSDIPFFIDPGHLDHPAPRPAIVQGFGDQITRLRSDYVGTPITLIVPSFGCHTGKVYQAFDAMVDAGHMLDAHRVQGIASQGSIDDSDWFNDLAEPAAMVAPELGTVRESVRSQAGHRVHVSGSGSTLFVVGATDPGLIKRLCPGCSVVQTRLI